MASEKLHLKESVSIALGGMIGGGIFAVLGVVAQITGAATWSAFVAAGLVAICAGYSYNKLNALAGDNGGSVTFVQCFTNNSTLAGMVGWTLLFGYIGSMAMYAYAFGSFAQGLSFVPDAILGLPMRPVISVLAVAGFVGINILGAKATGSAENVLVGVKLVVLLVMGVGGIIYGGSQGSLQFGFDRLASGSFGPIMAAAVSFVAFQGWQLLFYDQSSIEDSVSTIRKATYIAIVGAVAIYIIVAVTTVSLAPPDIIQSHPERALAVAAQPFLPYGFLLISVAALFSTGSAINATLFSSAHLADSLASSDLLPDQITRDESSSGPPPRAVVVLGVITAAFASYGSLGAITSFASLAFIVIFGAISYLAFHEREKADMHAWIPLAGTVGAVAFFGLMFWHLFEAERHTFWMVLAVAAVVLSAELLYFERGKLEHALTG